MKAEHRDGIVPSAERAGGPAVVHLVGRITDTVFSFLHPATTLLAQQGYAQTVILIDDPRYRHVLTKFHNSVRLVCIRASAPHADRLKELLDAYCDAACIQRPVVTHVHGLVCSVLGLYASHQHRVPLPTYLTPHGSRSLAPLRALGAAVHWVLRPLAGRLGRVIASSGFDADVLRDITQQAVHLVESPVDAAFFRASLAPAAAPCIVTADRQPDAASAALFAQCAVLLSHQAPAVDFTWLGSVDAESAEHLKAAQVRLLEVNDDDARARCMAAAWVFVAPKGAAGFPVHLAEAMVLGLPCVAWDTPYHRDLIRDNQTGFLCGNADALLVRLTELLQSAELRQRLGAAARAEAQLRFDGSKFRAELLSVYGAAASPQLPASP